MKYTTALITLTLSAITLTGCANLNSIHRSFSIDKNKSQLIDARQRTILVGKRPVEQDVFNSQTGKYKKLKINAPVVCAEPSPDTMAAYAAEFAAKGGGSSHAYGELSTAMQDSAAFIGMRTPTIQLLRDYSFRICEAYISGAIDANQYESLLGRFQKNLVTMFAIEQITGAARIPTIALVSQGGTGSSQTISALEESKKKLTDEITKLKDDKEKNKDKAADIQKEIDIKQKYVDSLIQTISIMSKTGMAGSSALVAIPTNTTSPQNLDKVVETIAQLTNSILDTDEYGALCVSAIKQSFNNDSSELKEFIGECKTYLKERIKNNSEKNIIATNENPLVQAEINSALNTISTIKSGDRISNYQISNIRKSLSNLISQNPVTSSKTSQIINAP